MINVYEELGEASRRSILDALRTGPKHVTDLVRATGLRQPNVSNHLARLRAKHVVGSKKLGRQVFYYLASPEVEEIVNAAFTSRSEPAHPFDFVEMSKAYARAATTGEETACAEIIDRALRYRVPLIDIYERILRSAMALVGTWYRVEAVDESHERLATEITLRMMARVVQSTGFSRKTSRSAMLGCPEDAYQVIGLRMISDYLQVHGWKTYFFGANMPARPFVASINQHRPNLVFLGCPSSFAFDGTRCLLKQIAAVRSKRLQFTVGVGGEAAQKHADAFLESGADFVIESLYDLAERYLPNIEATGRVGRLAQINKKRDA